LEQGYTKGIVKLALVTSFSIPEGADELQVCADAVCTNY
jgi:hypothetical protein